MKLTFSLFTSVLLFASSVKIHADENDKDAVLAQKKIAEDNWRRLDIGDLAHAETKNLLLYAPESMKAKLASAGRFYERCLGHAMKALFTKEDKWKGKLTVYLFEKSTHYGSFIRRVEKRRVEGIEEGSFSLEKEEAVHIAGCPPRSGEGPSALVRAAEQIGQIVIQKKAGLRTILPNWLRKGTGMATYWRALGARSSRVRAARKEAVQLVYREKKSADDVWNGSLESSEKKILNPSFADYMVYGPGQKYMPKILGGFKPGDNQRSKSFGQAIQAADLTTKQISDAFRRWVRSPR